MTAAPSLMIARAQGFAGPWKLKDVYCRAALVRGSYMPRYFFNTRIGDDLVVDPEGAELRDPDHAWEVAKSTIRDLLAKSNQTSLLNACLEVTDESGKIVLEFPFTEAIGVASRERPTSH